jgi:hypothetical protein
LHCGSKCSVWMKSLKCLKRKRAGKFSGCPPPPQFLGTVLSALMIASFKIFSNSSPTTLPVSPSAKK